MRSASRKKFAFTLRSVENVHLHLKNHGAIFPLVIFIGLFIVICVVCHHLKSSLCFMYVTVALILF